MLMLTKNYGLDSTVATFHAEYAPVMFLDDSVEVELVGLDGRADSRRPRLARDDEDEDMDLDDDDDDDDFDDLDDEDDLDDADDFDDDDEDEDFEEDE